MNLQKPRFPSMLTGVHTTSHLSRIMKDHDDLENLATVRMDHSFLENDADPLEPDTVAMDPSMLGLSQPDPENHLQSTLAVDGIEGFDDHKVRHSFAQETEALDPEALGITPGARPAGPRARVTSPHQTLPTLAASRDDVMGDEGGPQILLLIGGIGFAVMVIVVVLFAL